LESLDGIEALRSTTKLSLEWSPNVKTLRPVFEMRWLSFLAVCDFARLSHIDGVEALNELVELRLSGNRGSLKPPLQLSSLSPVARLPKLERFTLMNARVEDDDITCLAGISTLRSIHLSNQFERGLFAYLARHLNSQLDEPIAAYVEASALCRKCGSPTHMFTGRRMPFLCRSCNADRFRRLTEEFQALVEAAA
jgi:hypothetical protein